MSSPKIKLLYDVDERAPFWLALLMAVQHVMLIYSEIVIFPVIIGKKAGAPLEHILFASFAAALAAGLATLLQVMRVGQLGTGYILFMGSSAAYLTGCIDVVTIGGFALLASLSILVAPIEILLAYFLRHLRHIFTPVVGGVILLLVVISLISISFHEWMGEEGTQLYGSWQFFVVGLVTMSALLGLAMFGKRTLRLWCPILGMSAGLLTSWALGILDLNEALRYPWIGWFAGSWPGIDLNLKPEYLPLFITLALLTLINGVQAIGNSMAIQRISHRNGRQVDYGVVQGTMYADACGNILSGLLGTVPNETYSENISIIRITGVASRLVGICGAVILVLLPFSPKISMIMVHLPMPVYGGFLMGLAAMMFPAGLELVFAHGITHQTGLLVGVSLCVGMLAETGRFFPKIFPSSISIFLDNSVAAGGLIAVVLSLLFRLSMKSGYCFTLPVHTEQLPHLLQNLQLAGDDLDLDQRQQFHLQLVCEELFVHIAKNEQTFEEPIDLKLKVITHEEELVVEIIYGRSVDDIGSATFANNPMTAEDQEIAMIGIALVRQLVRDFHQIEISGITYIWFRLD
jgi:xanthine/uracil permease